MNIAKVMQLIMKTVGSVVKRVIGVALILALLHGIILMLIGILFAGLWTLLIFVLYVLQLPIIFVTLPVIVYLFAVKRNGTHSCMDGIVAFGRLVR